MNQTILVIFFIGLFLLGLGKVIYVILNIKKWPKVDAIITEKTSQDRGGIRIPVRNNRVVMNTCEAKIKYIYNINGKEYQNDWIYYNNGKYVDTHDGVEHFLNNLPKTVKIYYNPKNPTKSFLLLGLKRKL